MAVEDIKGSQDSGAKEGTSPVPATEANKTQETGNQSNQTQIQSNQSSERLPFHKDPEVKSYLDSMLSKREREWQRKFEERERGYTSHLETLNQTLSQRNQSNPQSISQEELGYRKMVAEAILGNPEIRKQYGLDDIRALKEELAELKSGNSTYALESELDSVAKSYGDKFGMKPDEVKSELMEFMDSDPIFGDKSYTKGLVAHAARAYYFDRSGELAERATQLRLQQEKELKSKAVVQGTQGQANGSPAQKYSNKREFLEAKFKEEEAKGSSMF